MKKIHNEGMLNVKSPKIKKSTKRPMMIRNIESQKKLNLERRKRTQITRKPQESQHPRKKY